MATLKLFSKLLFFLRSNGERWKKHRKMLNPSFQYGMLKERVPLFNEHASALVKDLGTLADTGSTDPLDVIKSHYLNALKGMRLFLTFFLEIVSTVKLGYNESDVTRTWF